MKMIRISPARHVIDTLGGVEQAAKTIGRHPSRVSRWQQGDGSIPRKAMDIILKIAKKRKLDITVTDLMLGREIRASKRPR